MDIPHGTWIVVADGTKFLLLRNAGDEDYPDFRVLTRREIENPPTRELGTDKPGRYPDPGPGGRSAVGQTDWHRLNEERFAVELAEKLRGWALGRLFKRLILVADPRILGVLRDHLHEEVSRRLLAEVGKDLSNHPIDRIEQLLKSA